LNLLGNALGVGWGKDTELGKVPEGSRQVVKKLGDSLGDANGGEDAGSEKGVATKAIVERVLGSRDVGVNPGNVGELFEGKGRDGPFIAFANPFEREVVTVGIEWVR
jgi:hypothetical protein